MDNLISVLWRVVTMLDKQWKWRSMAREAERELEEDGSRAGERVERQLTKCIFVFIFYGISNEVLTILSTYHTHCLPHNLVFTCQFLLYTLVHLQLKFIRMPFLSLSHFILVPFFSLVSFLYRRDEICEWKC